MKGRLSSAIAAVLVCLGAWGQPYVVKYPAPMSVSAANAAAAVSRSADSPVRAIIGLAPGADAAAVADRYGLDVHVITGNLCAASLDASLLEALASDPAVATVQADTVRPMTDKALEASGVTALHSAATPYTGKGVLVGIIDRGFDVMHPAFRTADGKCRIVGMWDQNRSGTGTGDYSYGTVYDGADAVAAALRDMSPDTHGTHVLGIAASSASLYGGVAPEADIAVVSTDGAEASIVSGIAYLTELARKRQQPLAINLSMGTVLGFKDGTDNLALMIDRLLDDNPDVLMAIAAGNEGHRRSTMAQHGSTMTSALILPSYNRENFFVTGSGNASFAVRLDLVSGDRTLFTATASTDKAETLRYDDLTGDKDGSFVSTAVRANGVTGNYGVEVSLFRPMADGEQWRVTVEGDEADYMMTCDYGELTDGDNARTIACTACGYKPVAVGATVSRGSIVNLSGKTVDYGWTVGELYPKSGKGPTSDGRDKPDITAPGAAVISAINNYAAAYNIVKDDLAATEKDAVQPNRTNYWGAMSGTSMATPVVTGVMALWLQADPTLTLAEVHDIIKDMCGIDAAKGLERINAGISAVSAAPAYTFSRHDRTLLTAEGTRRVELFRADGRLVLSADSPGSISVPAGLCIARITAADGTVATAVLP